MRPTHTSDKQVLVLLPTLNEAKNLPVLVPQLVALDNVRVLIVDDRSTDGTGDVADALAREFPNRVEVLHRTGPRGLGLSYAEAFPKAAADGADIICQMDADLSHDPHYLPLMIEATNHYDIVIGSRYAPGAGLVNWPRYRAILSRGANAYVRLVTGLQMRDCTSGYRCWRRSAVQQIQWQHIGSEGFAFLVETLCEAAELKCRVGETPIVFAGRRLGASKLTGRIFRESLVVPWRILLRVRNRRSTRSSQ